MRTSDSDSGAVTGLEIRRQTSIHFAGSARTRTVSLLKDAILFLSTSSQSISSIRPRRLRSTRARKAKAKVKNQKVKKAKDQKGPHHFRIQNGSRKVKGRPSQRAKVSGPLGHGIRISRMLIGVKKVEKGLRAAKENQPAQFVENQDMPQISAGGIEIKKDGSLKGQHNNSKEVQAHNTPRKFATFISILRINQFRPYLQINSQINTEVFETYDLKLNNSNIRI